MGQTQIMQQDKPGITGIRRAEEQLPRPLALVFAGPITVCALAIQYQRGTSRARTGRPRHLPLNPDRPLSLSLSVLRVRRFLIPKQLILLNQQSVPPPVKLFSRTRLRFVRRAPLAWPFDNFGSLTSYK